MAQIQLTDPAQADILAVLDYTLARFGAHKLAEYVDLLDEAQQALADRPDAGKARPDILPGLWAYPIGQPGRRARHLFLYRLLEGGSVVEILALVYDAMDLPSWVPPR